MRPRAAVAIAVGAAIGAGLRWAVTLWSGPGGVDLALLALNASGAALLGYVATVDASRPRQAVFDLQAFLGAGFCGALTTWSSLALRTAEQMREGSAPVAAAWLAANLVLGFAAAFAGRSLAGTRTGAAT